LVGSAGVVVLLLIIIDEYVWNANICQFALHYFFENKTLLHEFITNIAECTRIQGYFIATCYDGKTVFNLLRNKRNGESITIMSNERKIFEITKMYDETGFPEDDASIGYPINVYQESINQVFREYLVNFEYLVRIMEDFGFILATKDEAQKMNLPDSTGMFSELYSFMENEISQNPKSKLEYGKANLMTPEEKRISFMNRYFIFKKVRSVNTDKITKIISQQEKIVEKVEDEIMKDMEEKTKDVITEPEGPKPIARKIKRPKIVLNKFNTPSVENETITQPAAQIQPQVITGKKLLIKKPQIINK
jgi:hypothetical protein